MLFLTTALVIVVDQLIKFIIVRFWPLLVSLNAGIAFGLAAPAWLVALMFFILLTLTGYMWLSWNVEHRKGAIMPLALLLGGAFSNIVDRLTRGAVVDYLDLKVWPSFNLADAALVLGAIWLVWYSLGTSQTSHASKSRTSRGQKQSGA